MVTGLQYAEKAKYGNYIGIPYAKLDCQALMEQILKDCGIKYNWRGSNHMWREALSEKHAITDREKIPIGAWVFDVRNDGGEKKHGYKDNEGNACHVGVYVGDSQIIHSTTGGVQYDSVFSERWTHYGLCKYLDYSQPTQDTELKELLHKLSYNSLVDILKACKELEWL